MARKIVTEVRSSDPNWPPTNVGDFLNWLMDNTQSIPEKLRHTAQLEFEGYTAYGVSEVKLTISYDDTVQYERTLS